VCAGLSLEVIVIFSVQPESSKNNKPNQKIVDDMSTSWDFIVNVQLLCSIVRCVIYHDLTLSSGS